MSTAAESAAGIETLGTGMRLLMRPSDVNAICALSVFIPLPGAIESPAESGLTGLTLRMLLRGTRRRTQAQLAEAIESLGTSLRAEAGDDFSIARLRCTHDCLDESLDLLAETLQEPSFEPEELEKERHSTLAAIRERADDRMTAAFDHLLRQVYGAHGYAFPRTGTDEAVRELRREQCVHVAEEFLDPARYLAVAVGRFDPDHLRTRLEQLFRPLARSSEPFAVPEPPVLPPAEERIIRDGEQAILCVGFRGCPVTHPDYPALRVLNAVLGDGMSSRLFTELREKRGLAYATGSTYIPQARAGMLAGYIGTKPESLAEARETMLAEFRRATEAPPEADELERSRNYLVGKFLIDHQTNMRRSHYLGHFEMSGLGYTYDEQFPAVIGAVTAEQVHAAAQKYLTAAPAITELSVA